MEIIITVTLLVVAAVSIRLYQNYRDALYRDNERKRCEERKRKAQETRFLDSAERWFPHIPPFLRARLETQPDRMKALRAALSDVPGCTIGTTSFKLPVSLPDSGRRRHGWLVGRTGSGKTTVLNRIAKHDFARDVGVICAAPETEWFRDHLMPEIPMRRAKDVFYFAPGHEDCPLTFNPVAIEPGDNQPRCAADLYVVLSRVFGEELGSRMRVILSNACRAIVGREATLWDLVRILEDSAFRAEVAESLDDPNLKHFWEPEGTFDSYPKSAALPIITRMQTLLASPPIRNCLCSVKGMSLRHILSEKKILLIDLGMLSPVDMVTIGQCLLARIQLEIMRRESIPEEERPDVCVLADEFQTWAGVSATSWGELLSRGRRMACSILLANQFPAQLPADLRNSIFGNVATLLCFAVSGKDAAVCRKEFLQVPQNGEPPKTAQLEALISQRIGHCVMRSGAGGFCFSMIGTAPPKKPNRKHGERIKEICWRTHGSPIAKPVVTKATKTPEIEISGGATRF